MAEDDFSISVLSPTEAAKLQAEFGSSDDESMARLGRKVWALAVKGKNKDEIALALDLSTAELDMALNAYRIRLAASIDYYRLLDNERLEKIIQRWYPTALSKSKDALPAAKTVMEAIERRTKVLGAVQGLASSEEAKPYRERDIVVWLKEVMPSIERVTREVEIENGFVHPNGTQPSGANNGQASPNGAGKEHQH